jgi:hypothetical protein
MNNIWEKSKDVNKCTSKNIQNQKLLVLIVVSRLTEEVNSFAPYAWKTPHPDSQGTLFYMIKKKITPLNFTVFSIHT